MDEATELKAVYAVSDELKNLIELPDFISSPAENLFKPPKFCVPVLTKPLFDVSALGILNVCEEPADAILKSDPELPTSNVCTGKVNPLRIDMPVPLPP